MPDTGAPWNLRYPDVTDLVVDGPEQFEDLAEDVAAGLTSIVDDFPAGIGSNVVQAAPTASFSTTSGSFVDITSLSVSITPTSATSKILVILQVGQIRKNANGNAKIRIVRDGSAIYDVGISETPAGQQGAGSTLVFLDSPATASAVAYKGQALNTGGTDTVTMDAFSITAIEVAV